VITFGKTATSVPVKLTSDRVLKLEYLSRAEYPGRELEAPLEIPISYTLKPVAFHPYSMSSSSSSGSSLPSTESLPSVDEVKKEAIQATKSSLQSLRSFAAGGVGGLFAVVVGHPFDLVKVRLQTAEKGVYTGAIDVVRKTIAREGLARVSQI